MLCNDGLMIEKDKYEDEFLNKFNEVIKEKMNFDLQFIVKELNKGYTKEELIKHQIQSTISGVFTDLEAAQKIYNLYPYFVCCNNDLHVLTIKLVCIHLIHIVVRNKNRYKI